MRVVAEVGRGAFQHRLFHPVVGRFGDNGVGASRHMAFQRLKPAPVVLFQPAVNARTVKVIGFGHLFRALAQHTDGVHRHPLYVVHDIIGYFSSVFQPFWGNNALRYRWLLCMGRGQLPDIIVYYVA